MGLNVKEKETVTREYKPHYQKAKKKEKKALLHEFTRHMYKERLAGYPN